MKQLLFLLLFSLKIGLLSGQNNFSFVFLPDLHLHHDSLVEANYNLLVKRINHLKPDFILTGGDMIYTAKNVNDKKAGLLFDLMDKELGLFRMPLRLTMGNHETVGITAESGIDKTNPNWGKQMYEKRYGKPYYSFMHEGWKFFILDGIRILEKEKNYTQGVDSTQIEWLKKELENTDKRVPLVISIHTPLINPGAMTEPKSQALSENSKSVLDLFKDHDLKMVLQGHNHTYMNLFINGMYFLSGGSASIDTDRENYGFLFIKVHHNTENIRFIRTLQ
jgi:3',5'-cyclic-AMP phosphodiesterase